MRILSADIEHEMNEREETPKGDLARRFRHYFWWAVGLENKRLALTTRGSSEINCTVQQ